MAIKNVLYRLRGDTAYNWELKNPVLNVREPGVEIGTGRFKLGDGVTHWLDLDYFISFSEVQELIDSSIGAVDGSSLVAHIASDLPHPIYDDGPSFELLYQNAKV